MSSNNIDKQILANMKTHYSGLMKVGTTDFGGDFMSKTIFDLVNTDKSNGLTQEEIDAAMPQLDSFIKKSIEKDSFYADMYFGETYTEAAAKTDKNSDKTISEQIIENNLKEATKMIFEYAKNHPEDTTIQGIAKKLKELTENGKIILTDIKGRGIAGQAKRDSNNTDIVLIENHDSAGNLNPDYLLQTLLHELRHTMENDDINSKAEEVEAETFSRVYAEMITERHQYYDSITRFEQSYGGYATASPGTYNIPKNTGIAVWYKPADVKMDEKNNNLVITSDAQADLNGATIEDHIQFGNKKDEHGNPIPTSAQRVIKDSDGKIIFTKDYGKYNVKKKAFNYFNMYAEQIKLKKQMNPEKFGTNFGLQ